MTERKLTALVLVVFVTMVAFSGGTSVSLLSDSEVVNTSIVVGNVGPSINVGTQKVTDNSDHDGAGQNKCMNVSTQSNEGGNRGAQSRGIEVTLDPATRTVDTGNETTYDVIVEGASDNITSYELAFELCDPSVATFENFTHSYAGSRDDNVTEGRIEIDTGVSGEYIDGIPGSTVHLGTITVAGNASGQTAIRIVNESGWLYVTNVTGSPYAIGTTDAGKLTVTASTDPPTAENESYSMAKNGTRTVRVPGVLGNDTDADGDTLNASVVSRPEHGNLTLQSHGSFTYEPDPGFTGVDTFTYRVKDGHGGTDTATVSINVTAGG